MYEACLPSGHKCFVGPRRWRHHTVFQRERWEKSWLTMREMCPKWTVNLWIYYGCVTHREKKTDNLKRTRRMLLFVRSFSETYGLIACDVWQICGLCFSINVSKFSQKLYWNHHGFPLWRFCFSNIISVQFMMLLGFVLFESETCPLIETAGDGKYVENSVRTTKSVRLAVEETRQ